MKTIIKKFCSIIKSSSSDAALDKTLNKLNQLKELITRHKELNDELFKQGRTVASISSEDVKNTLRNEQKVDTGRVSSASNDYTKDLESLRTSVSLNNEKLVFYGFDFVGIFEFKFFSLQEERKQKLKQLKEIEQLIATLKEEENAKINKIIQTQSKTVPSKPAERTLGNLSKSAENLAESRKLEAMQQLYA